MPSQNALAFREILTIMIGSHLKKGYRLQRSGVYDDLDLIDDNHRLSLWFIFDNDNEMKMCWWGAGPDVISWHIPDIQNPNFDPEKWIKEEIMPRSQIKPCLRDK